MEPIDAARAAMQYAQQKLGTYGSNNKKVSGVSPQTAAEYEHKMNADMALDRLQRAAPVWGATMSDVVEHGRAAIAEQAGNCMECCAVACEHLDQMTGCPVFDVVQLQPPGDHVFVAIGQSPDVQGKYPKDFAHWNPDAAICDAWANIVCKARDYPSAWTMELRQWATQDVRLPKDDRKWGMSKGSPVLKSGAVSWVSPADDFWLRGIVDCEKRSFTDKPDAPSRGCCYITTAACDSLGLPDDCDALETLRRFRDEVMLVTRDGAREVGQYYETAPAIVAAIDARPDARSVYQEIYTSAIAPAVTAVKQGDPARARLIFRRLVLDSMSTFLHERVAARSSRRGVDR